jgi:hypothetical protein
MSDRVMKTVKTAGMTPRSLTRMYLIWCHCTPLGWGQSYRDVAEAVGIHPNSVIQIARIMGWQTRFRSETGFSLDTRGGGDDADDFITNLRGLAAE